MVETADRPGFQTVAVIVSIVVVIVVIAVVFAVVIAVVFAVVFAVVMQEFVLRLQLFALIAAGCRLAGVEVNYAHGRLNTNRLLGFFT